jgi:hypothetical protein
VLHELQVDAALPGIDARFLPLEADQDLLPLREWIEEQASSEAAGGHELLPGRAAPEFRGQVGATLLIDRVGELTQIGRSDPVGSSCSLIPHFDPF